MRPALSVVMSLPMPRAAEENAIGVWNVSARSVERAKYITLPWCQVV